MRHPDPHGFPGTFTVELRDIEFPATRRERDAARHDCTLAGLARHHLCAVLDNYTLGAIAGHAAHWAGPALSPHAYEVLVEYSRLYPADYHDGGPARAPPA
eukprot:721029-Rhodomonas_salina.1